MPATFYLGTHKPHWLWSPEVNFPLFVSHRTLRIYKTLYPARNRWALDSGGFTELSKFGAWRTTPLEYVTAVARYQREIGNLDWAAPQDWMCEPAMIHGGMVGKVRAPGTGLSVLAHQRLTVANFVELTNLWPQHSDAPCPFIPVLQGWELGDYSRCVALYRGAGVKLRNYPVVGIGSVCRRQATEEIGEIFDALGSRFPVHGFGVKTLGLRRYGDDLTSADSLAWSYDARRSEPMSGHTHKSCANCLPYAKRWRTNLLSTVQLAA
jgi:hypothetical protein